MSAQPVPNAATRTPHDVLDAAIGAAHTGGRPDLADRLSATRRLLDDTSVTVQVAGGAQQDRTALVAVLLRAGAGRVSFTGDDSGGALGTAVDAVLLVASAAQVIGDAELDRVRALRHRSPRILLALTAIDRHRSWRQVLEADLARLRAAGVTVAPFAVSVDMHRHAVADGDTALVAASGVPALAKHLDDIAEQAALGTARTVAQQVLSALTELEATPAAAPRPAPPASAPARGRRTPPDGTGPDRTPPDHTGPHRTGPDRRRDRRPDRGPDRSGPADRGRWQQVLADGMAAAASDVDFELRSRVRAAVADAERVVETSDPARQWPDIDTWLRARLTYEGEQTFALLADRTAEVAAALERELGGAPLRPVPRAPVPDLFGHQPPRDAPTGIRRPLATRSRSLVMSGYGGLMMALILPRFAGVQLPLWVVVGGALGAALLLGGAALSGERKRQLETRRNRAKSLVRHCADGFLLVAGKHTRDTLRRAQQQLRDECAARTAGPRDTDRPAQPAKPADAAPPGELDSLRSRALALLGRPA